MTNPIPYDGTGKLGDALAALHGISPKSHNKIAELIGEAKAGLSIDTKAKRLPDDMKRAIYRWHCERLNPVNETVETISQPSGGQSVELYSHTEPNEAVETFSQHDERNPVEIVSQDTGNESVEIDSQHDFNDLVRIAFYTPTAAGRKRQVIALDGYYLNALTLATGIGKADAPKWVQRAVDNWPGFDPLLPITKQVKYLIVRTVTDALRR